MISSNQVDSRQYWVYFFAVMFSLIGINLFVYSQGWYALDLSGNKLSVGLAWSLFFTPGIFLLPVIGSLLDSDKLKKVMLFFEFGRAFILLAFIPILYYTPNVYILYLMSACFGLFFSTFYPSIYVVLKKIISDEVISKYSHLFETSIQIASSVSILIAGMLYKKIGFFNLVALGALFLISSGVLMLTLKFNATNKNTHFSLINEYKSFFNLFGNVFQNKVLEKKQFLFGIFHQFPQNIIFATNIPLLLYVYETMKKGPFEYGILDALVGVVAMIIGMFWTKYYLYSQKKNLVLLMSLFASISFFAIGWVPATGVLPYIMFCFMAAFLVSTKIQCRAAILKSTPAELMGRLTSFYQVITYFITLSLAFFLSFLCQQIKVQSVFLLISLFVFLFFLFLSWVYNPKEDRCTVLREEC